MPKLSPIINAFNVGELSPRMYGRTDIQKYQSGLKALLNFNIHPQGGAQNRSGTRFVREVYDSSVKSRLIPFVFSTTQAYVLELADYKMCVLKDEGSVLAPSRDFIPAAVNVANDYLILGATYEDDQGPFRITTTGTLPGGLLADTDYYVKSYVIGSQFQLSLTPGGAIIDITTQGTGTHTIAPYGNVLDEETTPWPEADLYELRFAQSADTLYVVHPDYPPHKITRSSHTAWAITEIEFQDGPYLDTNASAVTVDPSDVTGTVTLVPSQTLFEEEDEGRVFRWSDGTNWFWGFLENYNDGASPSEIDWVIEGSDSMANHVASTLWRFGCWHDADDLGYPAVVTFNEQRLCFGANPGGPQTFYGSVNADYENFAPTVEDVGGDTPSAVTDDSAIQYTLAANQVNVIRWMSPIRSLIIGTMGGIWPFQATSLLEPITPTNVNTRRSSSWGFANIEPMNIHDLVVAVSFSKLQVFSVGYDYDRDAFVPQNLTLLADHITKSGIVMLEQAREPNSMVLALRDDGVLAALTYYREQDVAGWARHILGGSFGSGNAVIESVAVIPSPSGDPSSVGRDNIAHDQIWLSVKRTIDGATYRSIEFIEDEFANDDVAEDAYFVDCGLTYNSTPATEITGLDHLEGETVTILADGAPQTSKVVSGGAITLETAASKVHVGLGYNADLETLRMALPDPEGSSQGKVRRPLAVIPLFYNTLGGQIGRDSSALDRLSFRAPTDPMDASPPLYSGFHRQTLRGGYDRDGNTFIRQNQPLPMTILCIAFWMESTV
jgi:hypothetical protein